MNALGYCQTARGGSVTGIRFPEKLPSVREAVDALVQEAIRRSGGKQNAAGALIGISPQAISKRLKNLTADSTGSV